MTIFYAVIAAFIVGAGLAYGFRGWIERTKAAEKAALQQSALYGEKYISKEAAAVVNGIFSHGEHFSPHETK